MPKPDQPQRAVFAKERHIKYWLRCLRTLLPSGYTSTDSSRMSLAFFTLAALDLLDILNSTLSSTDRQGYIDWIYQCQLPTGGFRGSPSHDLGDQRTPENEYWDPATVPMTFFALNSLLILGDDFSRVERRDCLSWLHNVQNLNGSFGEFLGEDDKPKGGCDPRQCCLAAGIRYILRGHDAPKDLVDIDVEKLVSFIASCQVGINRHTGATSQPINISVLDIRWWICRRTVQRVPWYAYP
jgi:geranylgeranyl transferase type-1 subunit beta